MTKQELERINDLDLMIKQLERKRDELRERRMSITVTISDTPRSHSERDKMAEYMAELDEVEREYAGILAEHERLYVRYARAISSLRHRERRVLYLRYHECLKWEKIARIIHYSVNGAQYIHDKALKKIEPF